MSNPFQCVASCLQDMQDKGYHMLPWYVGWWRKPRKCFPFLVQQQNPAWEGDAKDGLCSFILALERQICWWAASQTVALQLPACAALENAEVLFESKEVQPWIYYLPAVISQYNTIGKGLKLLLRINSLYALFWVTVPAFIIIWSCIAILISLVEVWVLKSYGKEIPCVI